MAKILKNNVIAKKIFSISPSHNVFFGEPEEPVKIIQQKKAKKKQIIVLPPESDTEEEIVIKKESKKKVKELPDPSFDNNNVKPKILFY